MPETAEQPVLLNEGQVNRIIEYAQQNKMYEGAPPSDPQMRLNDAATLVNQARRARDNGNVSAAVQEICFIADVDQAARAQAAPAVAAPAPPDPAAAFAPPAAPVPPAAPAAAAAAPTNGGADGFDMTTQSDADLTKILEGLRPNASMPPVAAEIAKLEAELQRRQGAQPAQEVTPLPPAGAPAPPSGPSIPDAGVQPAQPPGIAPAAPVTPLPPGAADASGQPRPLAPDAAAAAGVQAPQPGAEGVVPQAPPAEDPGRRAAAEAQLTGAMLLAYGKTFADVPAIPVEDLERMIASPGGVAAMQTTPTAPPPAPPSSEREALEEQITGPMLKAYGQGRLNIPNIGLNELRLMISYPTGTTPEQVAAAREADGTVTTNTQQPPAPSVGVQPVAPPPPAAVPVPGPPSVMQTTATSATVGIPITPPAQQTDPVMNAAAAEIIQRENLPIPPDVDEPPALPADISVLSDEQLRSLHGRFHAVEVRCNWIISQEQDYIDDLERSRNIRDAEVRNEPREGKRPTKDEMAAIVASDPRFIEFTQQVKEREKSLNKIKVIRDNAHLTCQRCSREFSMRYREEDDVPRRGGS